MKRSEWSDEQLEHLLSQMPQMKDNRNPQEIYQNISTKVKKRRRTPWLVPSIAAMAAVILIIMIGPSLMNEINFATDSSYEESSRSAINNEEADSGNMSMSGMEEAKPVEDSAKPYLDISERRTTYVIREEDIENHTVLTFTVPIASVQFFTTVSVLSVNDGRSSIEKYSEYIPLLNHLLSEKNDTWGAETFVFDYLTYSEEVESDGSKNVVVNIPLETNTSSFSSNETRVFNMTMSETFRWLPEEYQKVIYKIDGKIGAEIGQTGIVEDGINIEMATQRGYFSYLNEDSDKRFLAYSVNPYNTIDEAFETMKQEEVQGDFILNPSIPEDMMFQLIPDESSKNLTITINSSIEDNDDYIFALEAMMLTAKEFGFESVTFEANIDQVGNILIGTTVPVPIAPNPIEL